MYIYNQKLPYFLLQKYGNLFSCAVEETKHVQNIPMYDFSVLFSSNKWNKTTLTGPQICKIHFSLSRD